MTIGQSVKTLTFFCATFLALLLLQYNPVGFGDPDGYYHVKMAKILGDGTILHSFSWLTQTSWETVFADQHFLYHLILIPFVKLHDFIGPQILNALLVTTALFLIYWILQKQGVRYPWFWTLLALTSQQFLGRMLLVKAVPLGIIGLLLVVYLMIKRKPGWLALVSALFVLAYGGFVFIPLILLCYVLACLAAKKIPDIQLIAAALGGLLAGLLLHPNTLELSYHLYNQIFEAGLGYSVSVGNEWLSPRPTQFIIGNILVLIIWILSLAAWFSAAGKNEFKKLFLQLIAASFLLLTFKSSRFIEYFIPFAIIAAAVAMKPHLSRLTNLQFVLDRCLRQIRFLPVVLGIVSLLGAILLNSMRVSQSIKYKRDVTDYIGAAQYLKQATADQGIVLNTRWEHFPMLFYLNDSNRYIVGMDPMFMYNRDSRTYWLWYHISRDENFVCGERTCDKEETTSDSLPELMRAIFHAKHVLVSRSTNPNLLETLTGHLRFEASYEDNHFAVFKLKD